VKRREEEIQDNQWETSVWILAAKITNNVRSFVASVIKIKRNGMFVFVIH
jgi:hypothetical protein